MKKLLLITFGIAVLGSCKNPNSADPVAPGLNIGFVRMDTLQDNYDYFQELVEELNAEQEEIIADLERRQKSLQEDIQIYQERAPRMSQRQRERSEADLMRVQQAYMEAEKNAEARLLEKQTDLSKTLKDELDKATIIVKDELNLDFVLRFEDGGILYGNDEYDITDRMIELLNRKTSDSANEDSEGAVEISTANEES